MYHCKRIHAAIHSIKSWYISISSRQFIRDAYIRVARPTGCLIFIFYFPQKISSSLQVFFRKRSLWLVAFLQKETCEFRYPVHLRHPVSSDCVFARLIGHFLQNSRMISGSSAEKDLQLQASYAFLPPCITGLYMCISNTWFFCKSALSSVVLL